jgi:hypothetical protein
VLHEILRASSFDDDGVALAGTIEIWDDVVFGLEWMLARAPEYYPETKPPVRTAFTRAPLLGVRLRVHYQVLNDHQVELLRAFV